MKYQNQLIQRHILLRQRRARFDKDHDAVVRFYPDSNSLPRRFLKTAEAYTMELEHYIPNEIIEELRYSELFRQLLSITQENYRPDHFDSYFGGLLQIFDIDFLEWITDHSRELKRLLHWTEICQLNANYFMWKVIGDKELTIKEMWYYERT